MLTVTDVVNVLIRPVGFRCPQDKQATIEEIGKWKEKENPNIILQQSYLTVGGVIATVIGAVLGIIGFKKDSKLGKWFGGISALIGIAASGFGVYVTKSMQDVAKKVKKSNDTSEQLMKELTAISGEENKAKQLELRNSLWKQFKQNEDVLISSLTSLRGDDPTAWLESAEPSMTKQANLLLEEITDRKNMGNLLSKLKDKNASEHERASAAFSLGKLVKEENSIYDLLIECINNEKEYSYVRNHAFWGLRLGNEEKALELAKNLLKDKTRSLFLRLEALHIIWRIKKQDAINTIENILKDESEEATFQSRAREILEEIEKECVGKYTKSSD